MQTSTQTSSIPLVIYDFRVLCFLIYNTIESTTLYNAAELVINRQVQLSEAVYHRAEVPFLKPDELSDTSLELLAASLTPDEANFLEQEELQKYARSCWAIVMNRGPNAVDYTPHVAVVVDDNGGTVPYWRKQLFPEYKGNRTQKPDLVLSVGQIGVQYVNKPGSPWLYYSVPGYEADDIAGALVYIKRTHQYFNGQPHIANRDIWLYTVDSDWLQLVGKGVTWYNTGPWEPRVRGHAEALAWAFKRLKVTIKHPTQIVDTKMKQGDKSDNLPKGTPRHMIDLMVGHPKYHLKNNPIWPELVSTFDYHTPNQVMAHYDAAKRWIYSRGYRMPT